MVAGQFDNFTTPYESFQVAQRFEFSNLIIIKDADHLMSYEDKNLINECFILFNKNKSLNHLTEIEHFSDSHFPDKKKQLDDRLMANEAAFLHSTSGACLPVIVDDLNSHGFKLRTSFYDDDVFFNKKWNLTLTKRDLSYEVLLFDYGQEFFRGMFKKCCFETNEKIEQVLVDMVSEDQFP